MRKVCLSFVLLGFAFCLGIVPAFSQKTTNKVRKRVTATQPFDISQLNNSDKEILLAINSLRTSPNGYAESLLNLKTSMEGKIVVLPDGSRWSMKEGATAIDEAIDALKRTSKLNTLDYSVGLSKAARLQLENLQKDITLGHLGADGSDVDGRIYRFGSPGKHTAENISLYAKSGEAAIRQMVIDDGLKSRIHRVNLLSNKAGLVGIASGVGKNGIAICVLVFADKFSEK